MPAWLLKFGSALAAFFGNAAYAAWVQNLVIVTSVIVALLALRDTDRNLSVSNAVAFAQKYYLDRPSPSNLALYLRTSQYVAVQEAKKGIPNYSGDIDRGWERLFAAARPVVEKKITETPELKDNYNQVESFFSSVILCVSTEVCDRDTVKNMLSDEMLGFYNAVCPYMDHISSQDGQDDVSKRVVNFLVYTAHVAKPENYFCRDKLATVLSPSK